MKVNRIVKCDGSSLWGCTENVRPKIKYIEFDYDTDYRFFHIKVYHNYGSWVIYTDDGFAEAISEIVSKKIGKRISINFTEQGMQNNRYASMQCMYKTGDIALLRFFKRKGLI